MTSTLEESRRLLKVMPALDERRVDLRARLSDRLAIFERHDASELFARLLQQIEKCGDVALPLVYGGPPPRSERVSCCVNRASHVVNGRRLKKP